MFRTIQDNVYQKDVYLNNAFKNTWRLGGAINHNPLRTLDDVNKAL